MSEVVINVLTTISLIWMLALIGVTVGRICFMLARHETAKLYGYLKKFKKGSCFLVYFAAIPLFFCALHFDGATVAESLFTAIEESIGLIVLSFEYSIFANLIEANAYFAAVVYICYVTVILNAILFVVSLAGFKVRNFFCKISALNQKERVYIIVGYNEENKKIIQSISQKGKREYSVLLVSAKDMSQKDALNLLMLENRAGYDDYSVEGFGNLLEAWIGRKKLWKKRAVNIIIYSGDASENLLLTDELSKFLDRHADINHDILNSVGVNGYVFCEPKDTSTFNRYVESSHGAIQYLNKYRLVAMDFVTNYPLTKFMTDEIDAEYPSIKKSVDINMVMIGFGKLNRQLFHTSVSTQQFLSIEEGKDGVTITEKPVHYCIYDKADSNADLILNHNYYRYTNFLKRNGARADKYLPFPEMPADVQFHKLNIADKDFYGSLYSDINGKNKYSYIVVSYGSDLENLDFGQKLAVKLKEWKLQNKVKLFVKIRDQKLVKDGGSDMIFIGDESKVVYNVDAILHEEIELLAKRRSKLYAREGNEDKSEAEIEKMAVENWYKNNSQCQREANVYACMSLRSKLNLIGFDICKRDNDGRPDASAAFMQKYQQGDPVNYKEEGEGKSRTGYREIIYNNAEFDRGSVRKYLAVIEHQRWNANYISWGFVPATKEEIRGEDKGKDFTIRRHGCLTTFEGLKKYRAIVAERYLNDIAFKVGVLKNVISKTLADGYGCKIENEPIKEEYDGIFEEFGGKAREDENFGKNFTAENIARRLQPILAYKLDAAAVQSVAQKAFEDLPKAVQDEALQSADVIRYDYQILDDVVWLLKNSGYKLVER